MKAWDRLKLESTIPSGTAWQHLSSPCAGGGGLRLVDLIDLEYMEGNVDIEIVETSIDIEVADTTIDIEMSNETIEIEVE